MDATAVCRATVQRALLFPALELVCHPHISGRDTLDGPDSGFLLVANHASHLDCPLLLRALPPALRRRTVVAAAADYFYRSHILSAVLELALGTIPFDRNNPAGSLEVCRTLLDSGHGLMLFPEGTRSRDGRMAPFKTGAARLAIRSGVPVVPAGISGLHEVWPPGARMPRHGVTSVCFAAPLSRTDGENARAFTVRIQSVVHRCCARFDSAMPGSGSVTGCSEAA